MEDGVVHKKGVLIVEDEVLIAAEIEMYLEELGFTVVGHTLSGDLAIDLISESNPDIVLLDISIKGSLNGIEVAQFIRKNHNIPFLFLTSHSDSVTLEKAKLTRPYGYVVKPFNKKDLNDNIQEALLTYERENG